MQWVRYLDAYAQQSGEPEPPMDDGRRKTHLVQYIDDEDDLRRSFYQARLEIKWLPSKIRGCGEMGSRREAAFMMPRWLKSLEGKA